MRLTTCLRRTVYRVSLALIATALSTSFAGAQLPIPSAGVIQDVDGATDKPDPSRLYKLAFDVQSMADSADKVSPALMSNWHAAKHLPKIWRTGRSHSGHGCIPWADHRRRDQGWYISRPYRYESQSERLTA